MIRPITFDKQFIKAEDDGHANNTAIGRSTGRSRGCEIQYMSNAISVTDGYFYVCGRLLRVEGDTHFPVESVSSGHYYCSLVYTVDLTQANTDEEFLQGRMELIKNETNYPELTQEDLDNGGEIYQLEFARFIQVPTGIFDFKDALETIKTIKEVGEEVRNLLNVFYPVGAIYMSTGSANPETFMGGKWERINGRTLVGVDEEDTAFNGAAKTGGAKTHTLSTAEIPSHTHTAPSHTHTVPAHLHSIAAHAHTMDHIHSVSADGAANNQRQWPSGTSRNWGAASTRPYFASGNYTSQQNAPATGNAGGGNTGNSAALTTGATGGTSGETGSGSAHNNLQPYYTVYMWRRIA